MLRTVMVALLCLAAVGCEALKPDPSAIAVTRTMFDDLRTGRDDDFLSHLTPQSDVAATKVTLSKLRAMLPAKEPRGWQVVGSNLVTTPGQRDLDLALEYDYGDHTALVETRLTEPSGAKAWQALGFHLQVATAQELAANGFNVSPMDTPIAKLGFLAVAIVSPLLMIAALVRVIRRRGLRRKWLWGIVAFAGLFSLRMNWATGQIFINWLTVQLIGAGVTSGASKFDPWFVTMTLPVGALLILAGVWANPARAHAKADGSLGDDPPSTFD